MADEDRAGTTGPGTTGSGTTGSGTAGTDGGGETAAERLIARFGGLRPMAGKLGIAVSTVQGWKSRGHIPPARTEEIRKAAAEHGIELDEAELAEATAEQPAATEPTDTYHAPAPAEGPDVEAEHVEGPSPWGSAPSGEEPAPAEEERRPGAAAAASPQPAPARRGSRGGAWAGGLVLGALLIVGGAVAAALTQPYWQPYAEDLLPGVGRPLEERLAPLQERLQALEAAPRPDSAMQQQMTTLQQSVSELSGRLAGLSEQLEQAPAGGGDAEALDALRQRVSELEESAGAGGGAETAGAVEELRGQVAELRDTLAAAGADPQALESFRTEVARVSARFDDLGGTIEQLRQGLARVEVLQDELSQVEGRLDQLSTQVERLSGSAEANAQAIRESSDARNRGALLALALGQLREALRFSEPYEQELQGVAAVASGGQLSDLLEPLQAEAASGVPNLTALRRQFSELAPEIVGATYGSGEEGWLREVMDRVPELVTVRPVGQATGDSVGAKVARAEQALAAGDLPAAVEEIASLEGEPAAIAQPWLEEARARLAVDAALADLTRRAIVQLSGDRPGAPGSGGGAAEPAATGEPAAPADGAETGGQTGSQTGTQTGTGG